MKALAERYLAPLAFVGVVFALVWRAERDERVEHAARVESGRIASPGESLTCSAGAALDVAVIRLGTGDAARDYAALSCKCSPSTTVVAGRVAP